MSKLVPETSTTLLRDVANPLHPRWVEFYARYRPMMEAFLRTRFPDPERSLPTERFDEVIQETMVALAKILPDFQYDPEGKGAFHNYLTGVLQHKAMDAYQKVQRARLHETQDEEKVETAVADTLSPSEAADQFEVYEVALQQLMSDPTIQARTKQVFLRVKINGEAPEAVAASLGMTRNAVNQINSRMRTALKELVVRLRAICR